MAACRIPGALVVGFSVLFCWIPAVRDQLYLAGRLGGTFQYSNTMALYFLAGVLLIQGAKGVKKRNKTLSEMGESGVISYPASGDPAERKQISLRADCGSPACACLGGEGNTGVSTLRFWQLLCCWAAYIRLQPGTIRNLEDSSSISLSNSTLIGRFLYWQDALPLVFTHPFGLGYMGYYYLQGSVQTGVYTTVFVHNDFLQLLLDFGWIPGIAAAAVFFRSLFSGKQDHTAEGGTGSDRLHSLFDFDHAVSEHGDSCS